MWPGNTTDVKSLLPVLGRLRRRFAIGRVCIVADRGMISRETVRELESTPSGRLHSGVRIRNQKEIGVEVLSRAGRYEESNPEGQKAARAPHR